MKSLNAVPFESGMHFVLGKLDNEDLAETLLESLPSNPEEARTIISTAHHYVVNIYKTHSSKVTIISSGFSNDGTASRDIQLQIDFFTSFPIPNAALKANKFNADNTVLLDSGCEVAGEHCLAKGGIAESTVVSRPSSEVFTTEPCTGDVLVGDDYLGKNKIDAGAIYGESDDDIDAQGNYSGDKVTEVTSWTSTVPKGSSVFGVDVNSDVIDNPQTLFEATYGISMDGDEDSDGSSNLQEIKNYAVEINGENCSEELQDVGDEDDVIFISGDCDIKQYYAEQSLSSENKVLTIGSTDHPKLVFIEGGTFINAPNTGSAVNGMLHFLPSALVTIDADTGVKTLTNLDDTHTYDGTFNSDGFLVDGVGNFIDLEGDIVAEEDGVSGSDFASVDMGGTTVNGAILSDYGCSHDGYDSTDSTGTKQHFSAHFDKLILTTLYQKMGDGNMITNGYRLAAGTWRDF